MEEKQTLGEVIETQALNGIYDALNEIESLQYRFESIRKICRLILGDTLDVDVEHVDQMHEMLDYSERLANDLTEQLEKAKNCYFCISRERIK